MLQNPSVSMNSIKAVKDLALSTVAYGTRSCKQSFERKKLIGDIRKVSDREVDWML